MPQDLLRARCEMIRRGGYTVLPLEEAVTHLYSATLPPRSVVMTFDDGGRDFCLRALPVLKEYGFPATVYITTYFACNRYPVFNMFLLYLLSKAKCAVDLDGLVGGDGSELTAATPGGRLEIRRRFFAHADQCRWTNEEIDAALRRLAARVGVDYDRLGELGVLRIMSEEDIREIAAAGVSVQLHTHRHRTPDDEALFRKEIRDNREVLSQWGVAPDSLRHFCYPSGVYTPEYFPWLLAENIASATTCKIGLASRESNPLALPRLLDTCGISPVQFEAWLSGASYLLPRRNQARGMLADL
jgi:hypothetical protein